MKKLDVPTGFIIRVGSQTYSPEFRGPFHTCRDCPFRKNRHICLALACTPDARRDRKHVCFSPVFVLRFTEEPPDRVKVALL